MKNLTNFCKTVETGVDLRLKKVIYWYIVYVARLQVVVITVVFAFMVLLERENCL